MQLGERERAILDIERGWWQTYPTKDAAVRAELGLSSSTYYRLLHGVTEKSAALAYDPLVVRRVRRARDQRRRLRWEGAWHGVPPQTRPQS